MVTVPILILLGIHQHAAAFCRRSEKPQQGPSPWLPSTTFAEGRYHLCRAAPRGDGRPASGRERSATSWRPALGTTFGARRSASRWLGRTWPRDGTRRRVVPV